MIAEATLARPHLAKLERCETRDALPERVHQALRYGAPRPLPRVHADVTGTFVRLTGYVRSYYEKQLAQAAVMRVPGIARLQNDLEVV